MSGFKVRVLTAGPHVVNDLGITLDAAGAAPVTVDLTSLPPEDVARSADLLALITSDDILIVDARDDSDTTFLSKAESTEAVNNHNDTHFGISGGRFGMADDPTETFSDDYVLEYVSATDEWTPFPHEHLFAGQGDTIGEIIAGMGIDGTDTTFTYTASDKFLVGQGIQDETYYDGDTDFLNGTFFGGTAGYLVADTITLSDGSVVTVDNVAAGVVTEFTVTTSGETVVTEGVALTQSSTSGTGTGFTLTPEARNTTPGSIEWSVNDVFLRNTGDTLDSGTLTIASGAAVSFPAGSTITIDTAVTTATIDTPAGGFANDNDLINKAYVDGVVNGLDWKESARVATTADLTGGPWSGTYVPAGGSGGTGSFTGVDLTNAIDGVTVGVGDRIVLKDQGGGTSTQNGIYVVTTAGAAGVIERAEDHNSDAEVSANNTVYVEEGTANADTAWTIITDDPITLNTTAITWAQTAGPGAIIAGIGLSQSGVTIDLDVDDLAAATPVTTDTIAFHDADGTPATSGSITRKVTFSDAFNALDVVYGITSNGIIVRTADDTYASRTITAATTALEGIDVTNGDGVSGNPTIGIDIQNRTARTDAIDTTNDLVLVWNASAGANEAYTVGDIAGSLSAVNSFETWARAGNGSGAAVVADSATDTVTITGGIGIDIDTVPATDTVTWTFSNSGMADTAVTGADTVPFFDATNSDEPEFRSFTNIISDLGLQTAAYTTIGGDTGTATASGSDTINLIGATNGGITTAATEPATDQVTFAITGADLTTGAATLTTADFIIVNDSTDTAATVSLKYTFGTMITDLNLLTTTTGVTDAYQSITGGDGGTATAIGEDTITFNGTGINIQATNAGAGADTVAFVMDIGDLPTTAAAVVGADEIAINDVTDSTTYRHTWTDVITDLGILTGISAATNEDLLGIDVTGTVVGLDILNLTDPSGELAATDEFAVHDKSEGTAGANRKMTGQNVADGVANILNIDGLTFTDINGQTMLTYVDSSRSNKVLSVDSNSYTYSDNTLDDGSWVEIGNAVDADAGHIMPFDGVVVAVTAMTENAAGNTFELDLFINGALDTAGIATLTGTGVDTDFDTTLDRNFSQGDRLRIQADRTVGSGIMQDTVVNLIVRWRDV